MKSKLTQFQPGKATPQRRWPGDYAQGRPKLAGVLTPADLAAFEALLRLGTTSRRSATRWLREHGYGVDRLGRNAIEAYIAHFRQKLLLLRDTAEFAAILSRLAADTGAPPL